MKTPSEMSGLELRVAIAKEVMGMLQHDYSADKREFPQCAHCGDTLYHGENPIGWCLAQEPDAYESSIEAAFALVEKMRERGFVFFYLSTVPCDEATRSKASFAKATPLGRKSPVMHDAIAETVPLAICRASLQAVRAAK